MAKGGFNLRKWNSNSPELLRTIEIAESVLNSESTIPESQTSVTEEEESYAKLMVSPFTTSSYAKILGTSWDSQSDNFMFNFTDLIEYARQFPPNKRSLLKFTAKIYDPLGLLSPFVIRLKVLFQHCVQTNIDGIEPLHGEILEIWNNATTELASVMSVKISTCYFLTDSSPIDVQFVTPPFKPMLQYFMYAQCIQTVMLELLPQKLEFLL